MATVYSTTNSTPLQYPSTTLMDRHRSNGNLYVMSRDSTANSYSLYRSTNGGTSWSSVANFSRSNLQEMAFFLGKDGWVRLVYRTNESSEDRVYIRGLNTETNSWETELRLATAGNGGVAGAVYSGLDVWQSIIGGTEYYIVAAGTVVGAQHGVTVFGAYTRPIPGTTVADNTVIHGTRQWLVTGSGRITPSIDGQHTGDGKTASNPHAWLAWGSTGAYSTKLAWNGDGWTGSSAKVTYATGLSATGFTPARWDGARFLVATRQASTVVVYERNAGNTDHATRTTPTHPQGVVRTHSLNYNSNTGDMRVYGVGTTIPDLYAVDYTRGTNTWGSWAVVTATDILGAGVDNWTPRRSTYGNTKYDVLTAHSGAPNTVVHSTGTVPYSPLPGLWNFQGLSHTNGGARQWNTGLPINWIFQDTDPSSAETAWAVRRQIGAGSFSYFRNSDSTWQAAEVKNVGANISLTVPANWATSAAEATHSYWLKSWNTADQTSGYTGEVFTLTPSDKVNPVITAPADASTVTTEAVTLTWTCTDQGAYQASVFIFGILLSTTGKIVDAATRSIVLSERFANTFNYSIQLKTWNAEGLVSDTQQVNISVAFVVPATPTIVATPSAVNGWIAVAITNPAPSGGQPVVSKQDLYRRKTGDTVSLRIAKDLASGATYNDWTAVSGQPYEYQVVTLGVNGATAASAWTG